MNTVHALATIMDTSDSPSRAVRAEENVVNLDIFNIDKPAVGEEKLCSGTAAIVRGPNTR